MIKWSMENDPCWFCGRAGGEDVVFSFEWDTPVHVSCIKKKLAEDPGHDEALILAKELEVK